MTLAQFDRLPEAERDLWIARWQVKRMQCPDCGRPLDECSDPDRAFYPYRRICFASMERAAAEEALTALRGSEARYHDGTFTRWSKTRSSEFPYPSGAGESIGVADTDLAPWDEFTTKLDASPVPPSHREVPEPHDPGDERDGEHGPGVGLALSPDHRGDDQPADREQHGEQVAEDQ